MFDSIAPTYDLANRAISMGADTRWRKKACSLALEKYGQENLGIIDVACGTGDMIIHWREQASRLGISLQHIQGVDPSSKMLEQAKVKLPDVKFIQAEAREIPLEDASADLISISYGIRNVLEREKAFGEFNRILKTGGLLLILEFTRKENETLLSRLTNFYTTKILPLIGGLISRNYRAYKYLPDSIDSFLSEASLHEELQKSDFEILESRNYLANVCTLVLARKK